MENDGSVEDFLLRVRERARVALDAGELARAKNVIELGLVVADSDPALLELQAICREQIAAAVPLSAP